MKRSVLLKHLGNGRFFSVKFIKRTNGMVRLLNGRTGVHKTKGADAPRYNDEDYDLITVWDVQKQGYRKIPADSVLEVRANHEILKGE